jgi:lysophospholipase L1-like esterase
MCGEMTAEMGARFGRDVLDHKPDYVPILGGTNDLGWNVAPAAIMRNLVEMFEKTLQAGGLPIPITVPSIRVEEAQPSREGQEWIVDHLERRHELNGLIRECARSRDLPCVDLFAATVDPGSGQLAEIYSNDGIHLTTAGYRLLAREIARVLTPLVSRGVEA